jgi:hypothetical protein
MSDQQDPATLAGRSGQSGKHRRQDRLETGLYVARLGNGLPDRLAEQPVAEEVNAIKSKWLRQHLGSGKDETDYVSGLRWWAQEFKRLRDETRSEIHEPIGRTSTGTQKEVNS